MRSKLHDGALSSPHSTIHAGSDDNDHCDRIPIGSFEESDARTKAVRGNAFFYLLKEELDGPGIITMTDYEESITYVRRTNMESITQERVQRKLIEQLDSTLSGLFGGVEKPAATQYIVEFQHRRWRITVNTSNEKSSGGNSFEGKFYLVQERMED